MWETWVRSLGWEDPLEKEMATHSSILAWRIPQTEELGGLQSTGHKQSDTTERLHFYFHFQVSCKEIIGGSCFFILSVILHILTDALSPLTFKVIIDRYALIAILLFVFQLFLYFLLFIFSFCFSPCGLLFLVLCLWRFVCVCVYVLYLGFVFVFSFCIIFYLWLPCVG